MCAQGIGDGGVKYDRHCSSGLFVDDNMKGERTCGSHEYECEYVAFLVCMIWYWDQTRLYDMVLGPNSCV